MKFYNRYCLRFFLFNTQDIICHFFNPFQVIIDYAYIINYINALFYSFLINLLKYNFL